MNMPEYLLSCLAEECAEVTQRATKAQRFGLNEIQSEQELPNVRRLEYELNDLLGVIELLREYGVMPGNRLQIERKKQKVLEFAEYSRKCGTLT